MAFSEYQRDSSVVNWQLFCRLRNKAKSVIQKSKVVNDPDDLRAISILPAIYKAVEHLIKDQILLRVDDMIFERVIALHPYC